MFQPAPVEGWIEMLFALPDFILNDDDELVADVVLARDVQPCARCGTIALHPLHDWRSHTVRHLPVAGRATRLLWRRLLACLEGCGLFVERNASIAPGAVWSRAAARAAVAASQANGTVDTIHRQFGVGWNTVMRAVLTPPNSSPRCVPPAWGSTTVTNTGRLTTRRPQFLTALVCPDTSLVVALAPLDEVRRRRQPQIRGHRGRSPCR